MLSRFPARPNPVSGDWRKDDFIKVRRAEAVPCSVDVSADGGIAKIAGAGRSFAGIIANGFGLH